MTAKDPRKSIELVLDASTIRALRADPRRRPGGSLADVVRRHVSGALRSGRVRLPVAFPSHGQRLRVQLPKRDLAHVEALAQADGHPVAYVVYQLLNSALDN